MDLIMMFLIVLHIVERCRISISEKFFLALVLIVSIDHVQVPKNNNTVTFGNGKKIPN